MLESKGKEKNNREISKRQTRGMKQQERENLGNKGKLNNEERKNEQDLEPELRKLKKPPDKGTKRGESIIKEYNTRSRNK